VAIACRTCAAVVGRGLIADRIDPVVPQQPKTSPSPCIPACRLHAQDRFDGSEVLDPATVAVDLGLQQGYRNSLISLSRRHTRNLSVADYTFGVDVLATSVASSPSNHRMDSVSRTPTVFVFHHAGRFDTMERMNRPRSVTEIEVTPSDPQR